MEFNEYIRWTAWDLEKLDMAEWGCMQMYEQTGDWEWLRTALTFFHRAEDWRIMARDDYGWYLV